MLGVPRIAGSPHGGLFFFCGAGDADSGQITDRGRVLPCTGEGTWSLTTKVRIRMERRLIEPWLQTKPNAMTTSQQTLNCALSVGPEAIRGCPAPNGFGVGDFLWKKKFDRTNPQNQTADVGRQKSAGRAVYEKSDRSGVVRDTGIQTFPASAGYVFNGEFDSGSERTLAAWIRHASRTGTFLVAIPRKF